ncbi:MAG: hypothetical protein U0838_17675 [Chloroflexota bacterium]
MADPVLVPGITTAMAIAAGSSHACALLANATVVCWGAGSKGQLGGGSFTGSNVPVAVVGLTGVTSIAAGGNHTCAVLATKLVKCWGTTARASSATAPRPIATPRSP